MFSQNDNDLQTRVSLDISRRYNTGNNDNNIAAPTTLESMINMAGYGNNEQFSSLKEEDLINNAIYNRALYIIKQGISSYMNRLSDIDKTNYLSLNNANNQYSLRTATLAESVNLFITNINYTNICNTTEVKKICTKLSDAYNIDLSNFIFHLTRRLLSSLRINEVSELTDAIFNSLTFYQSKHNDELQIKTWASSANIRERIFDQFPWMMVVVLLIDAPFHVVSQSSHKELIIQINIG